MRENFPFKETKSVLYGSMLVTGLEKGGGEGEGGKGVVITFSLILTSKQRSIVTKKISF